MSEFQNRTLICSVLFVDIVEYSRKPVVEQGNLKDRFNALLSEALRGVAVNDRIILDTGDGAAISFIGDPEDALFVATGMRDAIARVPADNGSELSMRMGVNLGPVRLVKDINGQPNIIGDGINVAQRVMTFAKPGQVLVSRSYYEVVSRLSDESSKLFSYEGARTDKHIREHEVYAVGAIPGIRKRYDGGDSGGWKSAGVTGGKLTTATRTLANAAGGIVRKPRLATALSVVAIIVIAVSARAYRGGAEEPLPPPPAKPTISALQPSIELAPPLPPIRGLPPEPQPQPATPAEPAAAAPANAADMPSARLEAKAKAAVPRAEVAPREVPRAPAPEPPPAPVGPPAMVSFAIAPWGEIHIDGKLHGVSPPLQELELPPGRHRVEIRNSGFAPHVEVVTAKAGERLRIKHKFN
ncbi:MAG TPA: adenylate/guanylate cyclase domain-containing protein [Burkholderiales bacterium]|nr:adenylate/guanylate cyclase domain-containing protein [Burkholderiales bacterium]